MSKRIVKRSIFIMFSIILLFFFAYHFYREQRIYIEPLYYKIFISDTQREPNPNLIGDYPQTQTGIYQFAPQTILASLDRGEKDVFLPMLENPDGLKVEYDDIIWNQSDFLRVANALSQQVWHEPLDIESWDVYYILFEGTCDDGIHGFNDFSITYYKTIKTGWETVYKARTIGVIAWDGIATWAGDGSFSTPFIFPWRKIELTKFKITAEQAAQIAEENGGKMSRLNNTGRCRVYVSIEDDWNVNYNIRNLPEMISVYINPFTGDSYLKK